MTIEYASNYILNKITKTKHLIKGYLIPCHPSRRNPPVHLILSERVSRMVGGMVGGPGPVCSEASMDSGLEYVAIVVVDGLHSPLPSPASCHLITLETEKQIV